MMKRISEYTLYKRRYIIGYVLAIALVATSFTLGALFVPNGLSTAERASAVSSGHISISDFDPSSVINLPYHVLQRISFKLLGVTTLSIKLPSIVLGVITVVGIYIWLREWFKRNISIIAGLIATTLPALIFATQDGTPMICALAVSVWLIVATTFASRSNHPSILWKLLAVILFTINFYIPLGFYLNLALVVTMLVHPHIRSVLRSMNTLRTVLIGSLVAIGILPIVYAAILQPQTLLTLTGIHTSRVNYIDNAVTMLSSLFGSYGQNASPTAPAIMSFGLIALATIGVYRYFRVKYTARSYLIGLWSILLIPVVYLNPTEVIYLLPVIIFLVAMGCAALVSEWYGLFPRNPYARVAGLIPLSFIIGGLIFTNVNRYVISYNYTPSIANQFNNDLHLLRTAIIEGQKTADDDKVMLVVSQDNLPFYSLYARYDSRVETSTTVNAKRTMIVEGNSPARSTITLEPSEIFTSSKQHDSDRFYLYTPASK